MKSTTAALLRLLCRPLHPTQVWSQLAAAASQLSYTICLLFSFRTPVAHRSLSPFSLSPFSLIAPYPNRTIPYLAAPSLGTARRIAVPTSAPPL